jgi:hypothetical protein
MISMTFVSIPSRKVAMMNDRKNTMKADMTILKLPHLISSEPMNTTIFEAVSIFDRN